MAMTVNNLQTLQLLNILSRTQSNQDSVMERLSTGSRINKGADDPAGMLALTSLDSELTGVDAAISNNQRTDAILGVAEGALAEVANLVGDILTLANEAANEGGLTADEISANQAQIDDALASIDRIIGSTQFNGKKLLDGSLAINSEVATAGNLTDVKVYSRKSGTTDTVLSVSLDAAASAAQAVSVATTSATVDTKLSIQGKLGTAVIDIAADEDLTSVRDKVIASKSQTGLSAHVSGNALHIRSTDLGEDAFVRTKVLEGDTTNFNDVEDTGVDATVSVNGQATAVDGNHVAYSGNGVSATFEIGTLAVGSSVNLTIKGSGGAGPSGATFQLGPNSDTRATVGIESAYTYMLGNATDGYLSSLASGGTNSLLNDPAQAAEVAREAASQISSMRGRIGGFQKFQVRTATNSLNDTKEGLEAARSVIADVDYAAETAELNRQNILMQSAISLLGVANQQSSSVLSLLM